MRGVVEKRLSDRASWATQAGSAVVDCAGCAILKREYDGMSEKLNEVGRRSITTKATKKGNTRPGCMLLWIWYQRSAARTEIQVAGRQQQNCNKGASTQRRGRHAAQGGDDQQQMVYTIAVSLVVCLGGTDVEAFSSPHHRQLNTITSTSICAGGGFGASSKKTTTKTKKSGKRKSVGFLEEVETSSSPSEPKLDRFGLPLPTEDDVFPPLASDILRLPVEYENKSGYTFDRDEVKDAIKNHVGVNLNAFDEHGYSVHNEEQSGGEATCRWKLNLLHKDPPVFQIDNFFTAEDCESYMSMADPNNNQDDEQPKAVQITSPTFSSPSLSVSRRTSTTWFCRYDGVSTLLSKAKHLLNVDLTQMEEPQLVRYRTGEEFSWHYDEIPTNQLSNGGQRLATLLVYLNDLKEDRGGGTVFRDLTPPRILNSANGETNGKKKKKSIQNKGSAKTNANQLTVRPKTGTALLFFPSYKDGTPDVRTLHKGEVALDTKMIAQMWVHEREYQASVPEGNLQADAIDKVEEEAQRLGFV